MSLASTEAGMAGTGMTGEVAAVEGRKAIRKRLGTNIEATGTILFFTLNYVGDHWEVLVVELHYFTYILSISLWLLCGCQPAV